MKQNVILTLVCKFLNYAFIFICLVNSIYTLHSYRVAIFFFKNRVEIKL